MGTIGMLLGVIIGLGAAVGFLAVAVLALFGGARATREQVLPGFRPDRPGPAERGLTLLSVWGPVALVALLCLLGAIKIVMVALAAL